MNLNLVVINMAFPAIVRYQHDGVDLYLDRDLAGIQFTQQSLKSTEKVIERSHPYKHHKDLNEWLVLRNHPDQKQKQRLGKAFQILQAVKK